MLNSNVVNLFGAASSINSNVLNQDIVETQKAIIKKVDCKYADFSTFNVDDKNIFIEDGSQIPKKKALFVEDKCINIVSNGYKIVQPNEVIDTFRNATGLSIDNVITNKNTGGLLLKSTLDNPFLKGEEHRIDLTFYTGHNGQHRTFLSIQALRMACMNQLPALAKGKDLWLMNEKHYSTFNFDHLSRIIEELPLQIANFKTDYEKLHDIKITKSDFLQLFAAEFRLNMETKTGEKVINKISDLYSYAQGQREITNDSAYKAYQAVTFHTTHNGRKGVNSMEKENKTNMATNHKFFNKLLALSA